MTDRKAQKRRLERAGFVHVAGWLPADEAWPVLSRIQAHQPTAIKAAEAEPLPRGRPKGKEA